MSYQKRGGWKPPEIIREPFEPKYSPSPEQGVIFDELRFGVDNIHCNAGAGSGKTSTMLWSTVKMVNEWRKVAQRIAMVAFNSDIAKELKAKAPDGINAMTCHSAGLAGYRRRYSDFKVPDRKEPTKNEVIMSKIDWLNPDSYRTRDEQTQANDFMRTASRFISLVKLTLTNWLDHDALLGIVDHYNFEFNKTENGKIVDYTENFLAEIPKIFDEILGMTHIIDFDDMMWLPIQLNLPIQKYDMMFFDESQDANNLMMELVFRMTGERIMTVGDKYQSIYGFAGATPGSIDKLIERFDSKELNLMTSYRCGKKIIEHVNRIMPDIRAFDGNPDGEVLFHYPTTDPDQPRFQFDSLPDGSMILARRNASLVKPCFDLIKKGRKAMIKGKEIGTALSTLADQIERKKPGMNMMEFVDALEVYRHEKISLLMQRKKPATSQIEYIQDQTDALKALADGEDAVWKIKGKIDHVFRNDKIPGVVLSSGHKSKGLEAPQVCIVDAARCRMYRENMTDEEIEQERNLEYVMKTRPKTHLHLVFSGDE